MSDQDFDYTEFEREFDVINMVFGAALSAYLGVSLAQSQFSKSDAWLMVLILSMIVMFILGVRSAVRAYHGQAYVGPKVGTSLILTLATGVMIQTLSFQLNEGSEVFSIIFRGWMLIMACVFGIGILRKRLR